MSTIGKNIQAKRKSLGLTQEELAFRVGYRSKSTINKIELGINDIPQSKIAKFAYALNTTPAYLIGCEDTDELQLPENARPIRTKRLPVLGNVACGEPIFANETYDSFVCVDDDIDADFCLTARGDSMINARIFDGDILFVKSQPTVEDGEIAVVLVDDEATVKRVYYDRQNNLMILIPENPTYKPMRFEGERLNQIRILGKVIAGQYTVR